MLLSFLKLIGREREISRLAIVDTGAKYCVLHEAITKDLNLEKVDEERMIGFGSKKKFLVDICILSIEINGTIENVLAASVKGKNYPEPAPKIVLGRNLLNKFKIILDGKNKKIYLE
jgi:predicted aspartyl protease